MQPIHIDGAKLYGAPTNWNSAIDGPCHALPVIREGAICTSVWTLTDRERQQVLDGQNVVLQVVGGQPPVILMVADVQGLSAWGEPLSEPDAPAPAMPWWWRLLFFVNLTRSAPIV